MSRVDIPAGQLDCLGTPGLLSENSPPPVLPSSYDTVLYLTPNTHTSQKKKG